MRQELNKMIEIKSKIFEEKQRRRSIIDKRFNNESKK